MKLKNIGGFATIDEFVKHKTENYKKENKNCKTLFKFMFMERENVFAEFSDGYRIFKITYGECADKILKIAPSLKNTLKGVDPNGLVGLYMANSVEWIQIFWAILACGFRPLLMNTRLSDDVLQKILNDYNVSAVISDGKKFYCPTFDCFEIINNATAEIQNLNSDWADEVIFMSSGTTENVKLCAYTGENLFYQVCDSKNIITNCPQIKEHYEGELKQLTLLPFYHVFGFIAVYIWFGFYSRTFVFLKDLRPQTLLNTVKRHKVTHIFAVPLVWDTIYKEALKKIKARGNKTYDKFCKAVKIANATGAIGKKLAKIALKEVRENIFGESIKFLISGGSNVKPEVLQFFNGIGYHVANGYGMTEIGITSVEVSAKQKVLNTATIGNPFGYTEYKIAKNGELLVKGKTRACKIIVNNKEYATDYDEWFKTGDLVTYKNGRYYIDGRKDDLIVCQNGENLNPTLAESALNIAGSEALCVFADEKGDPTLLISAKNCYSPEKLKEINNLAVAAIKQAKLENEIKKIVITPNQLMDGNDFKISRRKVAKKYNAGKFTVLTAKDDEAFTKQLSELERGVCQLFAEVLQKDIKEIDVNGNFFTDLGGTSLDYFALMDLIKTTYGVDLPASDGKTMLTVSEICDYLKIS